MEHKRAIERKEAFPLRMRDGTSRIFRGHSRDLTLEEGVGFARSLGARLPDAAEAAAFRMAYDGETIDAYAVCDVQLTKTGAISYRDGDRYVYVFHDTGIIRPVSGYTLALDDPAVKGILEDDRNPRVTLDSFKSPRMSAEEFGTHPFAKAMFGDMAAPYASWMSRKNSLRKATEAECGIDLYCAVWTPEIADKAISCAVYLAPVWDRASPRLKVLHPYNGGRERDVVGVARGVLDR